MSLTQYGIAVIGIVLFGASPVMCSRRIASPNHVLEEDRLYQACARRGWKWRMSIFSMLEEKDRRNAMSFVFFTPALVLHSGLRKIDPVILVLFLWCTGRTLEQFGQQR
jgi:hypothetical protein